MVKGDDVVRKSAKINRMIAGGFISFWHCFYECHLQNPVILSYAYAKLLLYAYNRTNIAWSLRTFKLKISIH